VPVLNSENSQILWSKFTDTEEHFSKDSAPLDDDYVDLNEFSKSGMMLFNYVSKESDFRNVSLIKSNGERISVRIRSSNFSVNSSAVVSLADIPYDLYFVKELLDMVPPDKLNKLYHTVRLTSLTMRKMMREESTSKRWLPIGFGDLMMVQRFLRERILISDDVARLLNRKDIGPEGFASVGILIQSAMISRVALCHSDITPGISLRVILSALSIVSFKYFENESCGLSFPFLFGEMLSWIINDNCDGCFLALLAQWSGEIKYMYYGFGTYAQELEQRSVISSVLIHRFMACGSNSTITITTPQHRLQSNFLYPFGPHTFLIFGDRSSVTNMENSSLNENEMPTTIKSSVEHSNR
jgi:hypothetical protein